MQNGWWSDRGKGEKEYGYKWPLYRQNEVREARVVFYVAGEQAVETARKLGLTAFCNQGGEGSYIQNIVDSLSANKPELLVIWPDFDEAGMKSATKLLKVSTKAGIPTIVLEPKNIWTDIPVKGDIYDVVTKSGIDSSEFIRRLEEEIHRAIESWRDSVPEAVNIPDSFEPDVEFTQQALKTLYGDNPWISVSSVLYTWTGTHYKKCIDEVELRRIRNFCNSFPVKKEDKIQYPYAKPTLVKLVLDWVKISLAVDPALINPPGLNCTNGVLQLRWECDKPNWELKNHDPALYYTYEPIATYNPNADSTNCDRLLEVLDPPQREIFLRTIAASLDLTTVRRYKGRLVRGLLLKGDGNNGKDTLREAVAALYGYQGLTGCTLSDFKAYDNGRKFPLSRLQSSRINWATENANTSSLDQLQSIKAFLTGDTLQKEGKGKDELDYSPNGVGLFNCNDTPNLQASLEAIQSRWGVLSFNMTFKIGADSSKDEIEADPRFKYDPNFLRSEVLPAFLNRVLAALIDLMQDGIDYSSTQKALEDIQAENSHLYQFCQDTGLRYTPDQKLTAGEIWTRLEQWYLDNGTLSYEETSTGKQKPIWLDQPRKSDINVKGTNQVLARFQKLFPKAKRVTFTAGKDKGKVALQGIGFLHTPLNKSAKIKGRWRSKVLVQLTPCGKAAVIQQGRQKPSSDKDSKAPTPISSLHPEKENGLKFSEQCAQGEPKNPTEHDKLGSVPYFSGTARATASPTASLLPYREETDVIALQTPRFRADVQPQLDLSAVEKNYSTSEEIEVWFNGEWVTAILLQAPNNHPNPSQRITGWKVRILTIGLERYFWNAAEIRQCAP
jgi:putative DNA primase/helicase